jgi:ABC-type nitrate/sulfonate/bicarbonate transport system permease component
MDEPFSALDEQNKTLLQEELLRIWEETKKTVVFITHSVDEAVTLGDRIMVMTANPGRAKAIIDVPFERPRRVLELRATHEYGELVYSIWGRLRDEVPAAAQGAPAMITAESSSGVSLSASAQSVVIAAVPVGKKRISRQTSERIMSIAAPLGVFALWEILADAHLIDTRFFPAPSSIAGTAYDLLRTGQLEMNTWVSLQRLFWGFLLGALPALVLGLTMGLYRPVRVLIEPLVLATYPIPKSAILPLILLIFGLGEPSKIVMVAIGVFYPVIINTLSGVVQISKIYLDVGHNYRANRWKMFTTIALPGALPFIMTGIKLGAGMGLILIAIAEMIGAQSGLGYMIWNAWQILSVNAMYVGLIVIALLGFVLTLILNEIERLLIPSSH